MAYTNTILFRYDHVLHIICRECDDVQLLSQDDSCHLILPLNYLMNDKNKMYLYPNPTRTKKIILFIKTQY